MRGVVSLRELREILFGFQGNYPAFPLKLPVPWFR